MIIPNNWYLTEVGESFGAVWFRKEYIVPEGWNGLVYEARILVLIIL